MKGLPDKNFKKQIFSEWDTGNFPIEWQTKLMFYSFRNIKDFPLNALNENKTIK